uniref:Uncharacterized protein n=1 Tax=Panagrolaimus sp. ES5 TaxID=591445 RepID=A0AC34GX41_9BILA
MEQKFPPKWTSSVISPRSASVNRSASFTNSHHTYTTSPLLRRPISGYYLPSLGGSTTSLNNCSSSNNINATNNSSAVSRLIETFNNERKGLIEEFSKAIDVLKINEINDLDSQINSISELEKEMDEIRQQKNEKENECEEYRSQIDSLQCELRYLSEPAEVINELQAELIQLKMENKDYREKQSILACTTCMDQPVSFSPMT